MQPLDGLAALVGDAEVLGLGQLELGLRRGSLCPASPRQPSVNAWAARSWSPRAMATSAVRRAWPMSVAENGEHRCARARRDAWWLRRLRPTQQCLDFEEPPSRGSTAEHLGPAAGAHGAERTESALRVPLRQVERRLERRNGHRAIGGPN